MHYMEDVVPHYVHCSVMIKIMYRESSIYRLNKTYGTFNTVIKSPFHPLHNCGIVVEPLYL